MRTREQGDASPKSGDMEITCIINQEHSDITASFASDTLSALFIPAEPRWVAYGVACDPRSPREDWHPLFIRNSWGVIDKIFPHIFMRDISLPLYLIIIYKDEILHTPY